MPAQALQSFTSPPPSPGGQGLQSAQPWNGANLQTSSPFSGRQLAPWAQLDATQVTIPPSVSLSFPLPTCHDCEILHILPRAILMKGLPFSISFECG